MKGNDDEFSGEIHPELIIFIQSVCSLIVGNFDFRLLLNIASKDYHHIQYNENRRWCCYRNRKSPPNFPLKLNHDYGD